MPCYDPLPAEHAEQRKGRLDFLTRNVCKLCQDLENSGNYKIFADSYPELDRWYQTHKREDQMRETIEKKRKTREPLTDAEMSFAWSAFS